MNLNLTARALGLASLFVIGASLSGCGETERKPLIGGNATGGTGGGGLDVVDGCEPPPKPNTADLCGNEVVAVDVERPNLYFLLDTSGSMNFDMGSSSKSRLKAAKESLTEVARELGHRIRYGLGYFPANDSAESCGSGAELFAMQDGDPITCLNERGGPILDDFTSVLSDIEADGGTPLSAAVTALSPRILAFEGKTVVLLVTDGAPNCNPNATCGIDRCGPNLENYSNNVYICDATFNCCDPSATGEPAAALNCVDDSASIAALENLAEAGIETYVIGVPGTEVYAEVMNSLAVAGGAPRAGTTQYYDVDSSDELLDTLRTLGASLTQSCEIQLKETPDFASLVNVYLDATLIKFDADNGWDLEGNTVRLHGDACKLLKSGDVNQVQVLTGCQTIVL